MRKILILVVTSVTLLLLFAVSAKLYAENVSVTQVCHPFTSLQPPTVCTNAFNIVTPATETAVLPATPGSADRNNKANKIITENQQPGTTRWKSKNFDKYLQEMEEAHKKRKERNADSDKGSGSNSPSQWTDTQSLKGYANKTSINAGEQIEFHVSAKVASYDLNVYRMGWYNGNGARWMAGVQNLIGRDYGIPTPDSATGLIAANWPTAYTLQTGTNWVSGIYLVWLAPSGGGQVSYILFVVRDDSHPSDILYQVPLSTYQAYNAWGGKSLYEYNSQGGRAYKVSFDRPYDQADGAGLFFSGDYNMVRWLESLGYNISYATSIDLETNPNLLANRKVFLTNFHDEYWSKKMRDNLTTARDQGKHLAFFSSNNMYWQIRFESSSSGVPNRVITCYKDTAKDPMSSSGTPNLTTILWRDTLVNRPENALLGVMFQDGFGFGVSYPWVVVNANHWLYEGTGLREGDAIAKLVGYEFDKVFNNGQTPSNLTILSNSPIPSPYNSFANGSIYAAPSGALIFDAATNYWAYELDGNSTWSPDSRVQRMTNNLLSRMVGAGPAVTPTSITPTVVAATATPSSRTFYRAINLGGNALLIDGNNWEGNSAANYSSNGWTFCNQAVPLNPATDSNRATMIRCSQYQTSAPYTLTMSAVPNASYDVYVYVWEDNNAETFSISLQGQVVVSNYNSGAAGTWRKLGPWTISVTNSSITLGTTGGTANVSGIEVWNRGTTSPSTTPAGVNTATRTPAPSSAPLSGSYPRQLASTNPKIQLVEVQAPQGTKVFIRADVDPSISVVQVDWYLNGRWTTQDKSKPFYLGGDTNGVPNGYILPVGTTQIRAVVYYNTTGNYIDSITNYTVGQ